MTFEDDNDAEERKIQFSQCRASFQPFRVNLKKGIYRDADAFGHVLICQKMEYGIEEVARLRMKVTPPPRPKSAENPAKRKRMHTPVEFVFFNVCFNVLTFCGINI